MICSSAIYIRQGFFIILSFENCKKVLNYIDLLEKSEAL